MLPCWKLSHKHSELLALAFFGVKGEICFFQPILTTLRYGWEEDRTEKLHILDKINFQKSTPLKALGWSCHMVWTGVVYDRWISEVASCKYFLWCVWTTCSVDQSVIIDYTLTSWHVELLLSFSTSCLFTECRILWKGLVCWCITGF